MGKTKFSASFKAFQFLSICIFIWVLQAVYPYKAFSQQFAGGNGTVQNPFLVSTVQQLQNIRNASNTAHFRLINNIDASGTNGWNNGQGFNPIGWFGGSIDGNGFTISNLVINRPGTYQAALVTQLGGAGEIRDLTLENIIVQGGSLSAAVAGAINGSIINVNVSGSITGTQNVGGLVGQAYTGSSITNCHVQVAVTGSGLHVGGLVGYSNAATVSNCSSSGSVSGQNRTGGLVGTTEGTIIDSHSTSAVSGSTDVGGLVGHVNGGSIETSYSTGSVTGSENVGGLAGFTGWGSSTYIRTSFSTSNVTSSGNQAGGLIGRAQGVTIQNTFATGSVTGNNRVGGLVGEIASGVSLQSSFSTGAVTGGGGQTGGLVGRNQNSSVSSSFWDTGTSGQSSSAGGTGRNTLQMTTLSTFTNAGWDFSNIWGLDPAINNGYPYLKPIPFFDPEPGLLVWTGNTNTNWHHAGNWSMNRIPGENDNITIPQVNNQPVISAPVIVTSISIEQGSSLTIAESGSLTVTGQLTNNAGTNGLMILSSISGTGSLKYSAAVQGSFQRYIAQSEHWQLLSSPVTNQPISGEFTPSGSYGDGTGYDFYTWFEPDTSWIYLLNTSQEPTWATAHPENHFVPGRGYLVSYQQTGTKTFSGALNYGQVTIPLSKSGDYFFVSADQDYSMYSMNLVGNPYPSSIDWKASSGWSRSSLQSNGGGYDIWIWSQANNNYGVYNSGSGSDSGTLGTSRYIAPNQGFFVRASGPGNLVMSDVVRIHNGSGNWINKSGVMAASEGSEIRSNILLRVEDSSGAGADEVIIEFGHQRATGSPKMFSIMETAPSLYISKDKKSYTIRRLASPDSSPVIPLSFQAGNDGEYRLAAQAGELDADMFVLEDIQTGQTHDFTSQGDYIFFATVKDKPGRFLIRFKEGNYANPHQSLPVSAYVHQARLAVDLRLVEADRSCQVEVFDMAGRRMFDASYSGGSLFEVGMSGLRGPYLVQISNRQGSYSTRVMVF